MSFMDWWENTPGWDPDWNPYWDESYRDKEDERVPIKDGEAPIPITEGEDDGLP